MTEVVSHTAGTRDGVGRTQSAPHQGGLHRPIPLPPDLPAVNYFYIYARLIADFCVHLGGVMQTNQQVRSYVHNKWVFHYGAEITWDFHIPRAKNFDLKHFHFWRQQRRFDVSNILTNL